ncbi:MAG: DinB family protein [Planctomycetota bacterium]
MIRKIDDFLTTYRNESGFTTKVFSALTDASLAKEVAEGHRDLGRMAWHIVQTIPEMLGKTGLAPEGPAEGDPVPATAAEIVQAYEGASASVLAQVWERWTDEDLEVEDEMYGAKWKRGFSLAAFVAHEVHHRGQMTVLMRQAGLTVPGIYGPAKEEWAGYGMEPPSV